MKRLPSATLAAIGYARDLAKELMRNREKEARLWCVEVTAQDGQLVHQLRFATVDETLDHLHGDARCLLEKSCEKRLALQETIQRARITVQHSRSLLGRSRGKPYLITDRWGEPVG
jgi:hypothetical protein